MNDNTDQTANQILKNDSPAGATTNKDSNGSQLKKLVIFITAIVTVFGSFYIVNKYIYKSKATEDIVTVNFVPNNISVGPDQNFSVGVSMNTNNSAKGISAAELVLRFNKDSGDLVEYVAQNTTIATTPENYFTEVLAQEVSESDTTSDERVLKLSLIARSPNQDLSSSVLVTLNFKTKYNPGTSKIELSNESSTIVGLTGTDADHAFTIDSTNATTNISISGKSCTTNAECGANGICENNYCFCGSGFYNCDNDWSNGCESSTSCDMNLNISLRLQGVALKKPTLNTTKVLVKINARNGTNIANYENVVFTAETDHIFKATIPLSNVTPNDNYRILVKPPKHLQKKFCSLNPQLPDGIEESTYVCQGTEAITLQPGANTADFSAIPIYVGDLPVQDSYLNAKDVAAVSNCIGNQTEECINKADLNYDNTVNATDFSLLIQSMQLKTDEEE
jgi:hypothetical protein